MKVPADSSNIMSGYLVVKGSSRGPSVKFTGKRWFSLLPDFVLYTFRSSSDQEALTATPMPGYSVWTGSELRGDSSVTEKDRDRVIKMCYQPGSNSSGMTPVQNGFRRVYYLAGTCPQNVARYMEKNINNTLRFLKHKKPNLIVSSFFQMVRSPETCHTRRTSYS